MSLRNGVILVVLALVLFSFGLSVLIEFLA